MVNDGILLLVVELFVSCIGYSIEEKKVFFEFF